MARLARFHWIAYAAALVAVYTAVLPKPAARIPDGILTIFQAHRVAGEDYLLRAERPDAVLVGSSLSAVLPQIALGPVYNLSMSGGSALTGLRLVAAASQAPRLVFIEANVLERPADETLLAELLNPAGLRLKSWCEACRTRNQPLTVGLSTLSALRLKTLDAQQEDSVNMAARRTPASTRQMLALQLEASGNPVEPALMQRSLDEVAAAVTALERAGSKVVFVEMPMHQQIADSPHNRSVMSASKARFPASSYEWLRFTDREYQTSDGQHLLYPDARSVAGAMALRSAADPR